jgi:DNA primase
MSNDILARLIEEEFGLEGNGRWFRSKEHSSLVLDRERDIFFFNKIGVVGDSLIYLTKIRGMGFQEAKDYLKTLNYSGTFVYSIRGKESREDVVVYPYLVEVFWQDGKNKRDYMYRRGITDETLDRFQVGFFNNWTMIPFFEDGTFRNFQMRRDEPSKCFRSYYKTGDLLFNSDIMKLTNKVYITEGPVDALSLVQNGLPAISTSAGGAFLPEWYNKFVDQKEIVILGDNDVAGENEAKRTAKLLGETRCKIYTFQDFNQEGFDPVNFFQDGNTKDQLLELIERNGKYVYEMGGYKKWKKL